jgi:hypothetical protein
MCKFTIKSVRPTYESYKFNNEFQKKCAKYKQKNDTKHISNINMAKHIDSSGRPQHAISSINNHDKDSSGSRHELGFQDLAQNCISFSSAINDSYHLPWIGQYSKNCAEN